MRTPSSTNPIEIPFLDDSKPKSDLPYFFNPTENLNPFHRTALMKTYGENAILISRLPAKKTPEYLQDRLKKFLSKFGTVTSVRVFPHPLDPYQSNGTAVVSLESKTANLAVLESPLLMDGKALSMEWLGERKLNDVNSVRKWKARSYEVADTVAGWVSQLEQNADAVSLYALCIPHKIRLLSFASNFEEFFKLPEMRKIFCLRKFPTADGDINAVEKSTIVRLRPHVSSEERSDLKLKLRLRLQSIIDGRCSIPWRAGKIPVSRLPEATRRQIRRFDAHEKLPENLQTLSRDFRREHVFDEKRLLREKRLKK